MFSDRIVSWMGSKDIHKHVKNKKFTFDDGKIFSSNNNTPTQFPNNNIKKNKMTTTKAKLTTKLSVKLTKKSTT